MLASELVRRGHSVVWWTSTVNHFNKTYHDVKSSVQRCGELLQIQFLHGPMYRRNISLQRLKNHRVIALEFRRLADSHHRPDIILCSFPTIELSYEAVQFSRRERVPVLLDVRDLWPDEIEARVPNAMRWLLPLILKDLYEKTSWAFRYASGIIGISRGYLDWGLRHANRALCDSDIVAPHGYPPPLQPKLGRTLAELLSIIPPTVDHTKKIFWFVGTFVGSIDLGTVIEAARRLSHRSDIQFVLTGHGERGEKWLAQSRGLSNVVFTGWANQDQLAALASVAYAGLAAYKRNALMSLTNKIFEYLGFGIPVLCSLPGEARRLLEESGAGSFYTPEDAPALATAIEALAEDPSARNRMARAARELFEREFSADKVYSHFADHLETCASEGLMQDRMPILP